VNDFLFNADPWTVGIELSGATGDIHNSLISTGDGGYWDSDASDTINYSWSIFSTYNVTLNVSRTYTGINFADCWQVTLQNNAKLDTCVVDASTATYWCLIDSASSSTISNSTFSNNSEYWIGIIWTTDITLDNVEFDSNTTKDLYFTATTWAITVTTTVPWYVPTYNTAGVTVTIASPLAGYNLEFPNIIDGSRYQVYNVTTTTELSNTVVAGGSWITDNFVEWVDFTVWDTWRYRISYCVWTTAKLELEGFFVFPSWDNTSINPVTQEDDEVYNDNAIDWSSVTEFTSDYPNVEIDVYDPDNTTTPQRIYAWFVYNWWTASWISTWFGGMLAEDDINYRVITSRVDLHIQNKNIAALVIVGARIYRDDYETILIAGTWPIQVDPLKAYIAPEVISMSKFLSFEGFVWLDVDDGVDTSEDLCGTRKYPCKTLTKALSVASSAGKNFSTIQLAWTLTLDQTVSWYEFIGWKNGKIDLNNQVMLATRFRELKVYWVQNTVWLFFDCRITNLQWLSWTYTNCKFLWTHTIKISNWTTELFDCDTQAWSGEQVFDWTDALPTGAMHTKGLNWKVKFQNCAVAWSINTISCEGAYITLDSTLTAGMFMVSGIANIVDSSGTATIIKWETALQQTSKNILWLSL